MTAPGHAATAIAVASDLGRKLVARGLVDLVVGTFIIELPCVAAIRAVALAGFDFVVIDMEHSTIGFDALEPLVSAAQGLGVSALVRVWGEDEGLIVKALESGANGVLVPHVGSVRRAREIVRQTRFPPRGERSFSPLTRYDALGQSKAEISDRTVVIVQIEGVDGLAAAAEIAATPGIDGIFVGPHDLSSALDIAIGDPAFVQAAKDLVARTPKSSVMGIYIDRPENCRLWDDIGFHLQCVSFDARMLVDAASSVVGIARSREGKAA